MQISTARGVQPHSCTPSGVLNSKIKGEEPKESVKSMKLIPRKPVQLTKGAEKPVEEKKTRKKKDDGTLPADTYKDEIPPLELVLSDTSKLVFSVKRGGEYGLPHVDIRTYVMTEVYTGFTKKGINFPLEFLPDLIDHCKSVYETCSEKGLTKESEDEE